MDFDHTDLDIHQLSFGNSQFKNIREGMLLYKNKKLFRRRPTISASKLYSETITLLEKLLHFDKLQSYVIRHGPLHNFIGSFSLGFTTGGTLPKPVFAFFRVLTPKEEKIEKTEANQKQEETFLENTGPESEKKEENNKEELIHNVSSVVNKLNPQEIIDFYENFYENVVKKVRETED